MKTKALPNPECRHTHHHAAMEYNEIAEQLGLTIHQVRRAAFFGLKKCRAYCEANNLSLEDLLPDIEAIVFDAPRHLLSNPATPAAPSH